MFPATGANLRIDDKRGERGGVAHLIEAVFDQAFNVSLDLQEVVVDDVFRDFFRGQMGVRRGGLRAEEDLAMKGFQRHRLVGAVGRDTDKFTGGKGCYLARRHGEIELKALAGGNIAVVCADGGPFLEDLADELASEPGGIAGYLACQEVCPDINERVGVLTAVLFSQLIEGLHAEDQADLVLPASGHGNIHVLGVEGREFVDIDLARCSASAIDNFKHAAYK